MGMNQQRRQKKLEKKRTQRNEVKKNLARIISGGMGSVLQKASSWPILDCKATIQVDGILVVSITRRGPEGEIAVGNFLIDIYCLGAKDCFGRIMNSIEYRNYIEKLRERECIAVSPEDARKQIESAVEYARGLGIAPHPDYRIASHIFGNIDASASTRQFQYGKDGKPFYVQGPYESEARVDQILKQLTKSCGPDGFHFMLGGPIGSLRAIDQNSLLDVEETEEGFEDDDQDA